MINEKEIKRNIAQILLSRGYSYANIRKKLTEAFGTGMSYAMLKELSSKKLPLINIVIQNIQKLIEEIEIKIFQNKVKKKRLTEFLISQEMKRNQTCSSE
jgi:hypothetical protein